MSWTWQITRRIYIHYVIFQHIYSSSFSSLTTFRMSYVNVTGDILEYLISQCPFLEVLCISNSSNVSGPSLKLKYLEIHKYIFYWGLWPSIKRIYFLRLLRRLSKHSFDGVSIDRRKMFQLYFHRRLSTVILTVEKTFFEGF